MMTMMKKVTRAAVVVGLVAVVSGCGTMMKEAMVEERVSPYDLDTTVKTIVSRAKERGWKVPGIKDMRKSIKKHGGPDLGTSVKLIELCHPGHASKLLAEDEYRYVSVMMPCTISVYNKADGKTYVTNLEARRMGGMLGGTVAEVMGGGVADDQDYFLEFLNQAR